MSGKKLLTLATILVGTHIIVSNIFAEERGPTVGGVVSDEFAGKIVDIQTTTKRTFVLENVKLIQVGGQWFFSGRGINNYGGLWWEGVQVRVNLSSVVSYCPMTPQQWGKARGKFDEK